MGMGPAKGATPLGGTVGAKDTDATAGEYAGVTAPVALTAGTGPAKGATPLGGIVGMKGTDVMAEYAGVVAATCPQPRRVWRQHQAFFKSDQPVFQSTKPTLQSKGQPLAACLQHQSFFASDHDNLQLL